MVARPATTASARHRAADAPGEENRTEIRALGRIPVLDALRGIAILLVLLTHARLVPGGALGVDLFFVLSGFLITSLLVTEFGRAGRISLGAFFRRRALRLFPALIVMLGVYLLASAALAVLGYLGDDELVTTVRATGAGFGYVTNLVAETGLSRANPLSHLWSLAQEEQFYLLWPPIFFLLLRKRARPTAVVAGLVILAVYVTTWRSIVAHEGGSYEHIWYGADTRADSIIAGCVAGLVFSYRLVPAIPRWLPLVALALGCLSVWKIELTRSPLDAGVYLPLFVLACAVIVLASAHDPASRFSRALDRVSLRRLGRISYGLYLWHLPIFAAIGWEAGIPVSIVVAALSYRFVEQPFLSRKQRPPAPQERIPLPPSAAPAPASA